MPTYLVERYWPGVTSEVLLEALRRGRLVMEEMSVEGTCVRDISCTLIPDEEVVFSLYEGPSTASLRQFNEQGRHTGQQDSRGGRRDGESSRLDQWCGSCPSSSLPQLAKLRVQWLDPPDRNVDVSVMLINGVHDAQQYRLGFGGH